MKSIDIRTLVRAAAVSLEADGLLPPGGIKIGEIQTPASTLYGDPDGIRNLLLLLLSSAEGSDSGVPVECSVSYERGPDGPRLTLTIRAARIGLGTDEPGRLFEDVSCTLRTASKPAGDGAAGIEELRCSIPVWSSNEPERSDHAELDSGDDPPFSFEAIVSELKDRSVARKIVAEYLEYLDEQFGRLHEAIVRGDSVAVHREAHSIKGGSMNIRAERLQRIAHSLELEANAGRLENAREMLENMREARQELVSYLAELPEGNGP
jgi:HPt (histidine-containing phosphotransfer) domain-containing protein